MSVSSFQIDVLDFDESKANGDTAKINFVKNDLFPAAITYLNSFLKVSIF